MWTTRTGLVSARAGSKPWVHGALIDVLLAWCWLPIALLMRRAESSITQTQALMAMVFLLSFAHQPLTLGLVYGDRTQFRAHRRFYLWTPLVAAISIAIGLRISLTIVALMAGVWNAEHTLMQRYGLMRIYGRKAGDEHGPLEKRMLLSWLVVSVLFLGSFVDLLALGARVGMDRTNTRTVQMLESMSSIARVLFWIGVAVAVAVTAMWVRAERRSHAGAAQRAKWIYAASTFGLVVAVMIDPLAGLAGFVAAHAIEYFAIVHGTLRRRASNGDPSPVVMATATTWRRLFVYGAYVAAILAIVIVSSSRWDGRVYAFLVLFFGALHILYDGLVWKLRKPTVAASLGIGGGAGIGVTGAVRPVMPEPPRVAG